MKAVNTACFKLEPKANNGDKKNKNNFVIILGDQFTMRIRLTLQLYKLCLVTYISNKISN